MPISNGSCRWPVSHWKKPPDPPVVLLTRRISVRELPAPPARPHRRQRPRAPSTVSMGGDVWRGGADWTPPGSRRASDTSPSERTGHEGGPPSPWRPLGALNDECSSPQMPVLPHSPPGASPKGQPSSGWLQIDVEAPVGHGDPRLVALSALRSEKGSLELPY